jgi:sec-independent protein translocase protein TatC
MDEHNGGDAPSDDRLSEPGQDRRSLLPARMGGGKGAPPPPPPTDGDDDDEGMLRMSFLQHLEELRSRLIKSIVGALVAFVACIGFGKWLWDIIKAPAVDALTRIGIKPPQLVSTEPMESFNIMWFKVPAVAALFVAAPWILYQVWAFIAPGLYKRERKWAIPFVLCTAGLFIGGGLFAYFVAFRFGLTFLLQLAVMGDVTPLITITSYFDLFMNVMLGVALVFELPVVIFFLILLRIVTPQWLMANSRYAILGIVILAAIVTPTPDALNMMLFATPMLALYFLGLFAGYLLVLRREGRKFPWLPVLMWTGLALLILAGFLYLAIWHFHLHWIRHWPFLIKPHP